MPEASGEDLIATIRGLLARVGPCTSGDLIDALRADGVVLPPDPEAVLEDLLDGDDDLFLMLADERWAWLPALLDGRVFTHRLTAPEVRHDVLRWHQDLEPLWMLTEGSEQQRLSDGAPIVEAFVGLDDELLAARGVPETVAADAGVILLPPGRLAALGLGPGDLIGVRAVAAGFDLTAVTETVSFDLQAALTPVLDLAPDRPMPVDAAVWTACADDDAAFRQPVAPLSEQLAASGLSCDGDYVALPGFDYDTWTATNRIALVARRYGLDEDEALAVLVISRLHQDTADVLAGGDPDAQCDIDDPVVRATLEFLEEPSVAVAVLAEIPSGDRLDAAALGALAESAEAIAPRPARPALRWLHAKAHERLGDIAAAERTYEQAESMDPSWPLTLLALARYAEDRSDAERALALLRRAGMPDDHPRVAYLKRYRPSPRTGLGRNERCWCGSGRKYKACHLNREQLPLEERAGWLYQKAVTDIMEGEFGPLLLACARARAQFSADPGAFDQALHDDPLPLDVVLFEGGAFEDFIAERGVLLPDDERVLAEQWLFVERSVHEVTAARPGEGMTMRDVRTGDIHEVSERSASSMVRVGEFFCGRIVPAGDTMQIFGGMEPLSLVERDQLVAILDEEPDPVELVAILSRRFAPPTLANTEGEPIVLCDATLRVDDPGALSVALDAAYERVEDDDDGASVWLEKVITHGMPRIRAHLDLRADLLHIHANSHNRFERVLAAVRTLCPSAIVLSETREPVGTMAGLEQLATAPPAGVHPAPPTPEMAAGLEELVRTHEQAWLDDPIPALSGCTPRECAADPTRRDDLVRLLDSFPDTDTPGTMNVGRLREELGISRPPSG